MEIWNKAKKNKFDFLSLDFNDLKAYRNYEEVIYDRDNEFNLDKDEPENEEDLNNSNPDTEN